jgi:predicted naringenin-chalcone synthase
MTSRTTAHINRIGTAVPPFDVHEAFVGFVDEFIPERRNKLLFKRMVGRAGIGHRFSYFEPQVTDSGASDRTGFYIPGAFPTTGERMALYEERAPALAAEAVAQLGLGRALLDVTHLIVASCTGMMAPGLDQRLVEQLGLSPAVERTVVGFMGCYAAVNSLRLARHIVRSEPDARVLVVTAELCTLHFQQTSELERLLAMLLFGDGASAALVTADEEGLALGDFRSATIPDSAGLIRWEVRDQGFDMLLSGEVPTRIGAALGSEMRRNDPDGLLRGQRPEEFDAWAVHAGGRTILDSVESGFGLEPQSLCFSRGVLHDYGNMSSATLMFVLDRLMRSEEAAEHGMAMAFGPGLAAETFRFQRVH